MGTTPSPVAKPMPCSSRYRMGHFNCIGYAFSGWLGKLIGGKKADDTKEKTDSSNVNLPKWFELFRDFVFSVAMFMVVLFYIVTIACAVTGNMEAVTKACGNDIWFIWPIIEGLQFAAGMSVLIYGVRQFIAEITAAFVAISEKYIPDSKPAVDCPAVFPFAPNAVLVGFIGAFLGGLFAMALMVAFHSETIMKRAVELAKIAEVGPARKPVQELSKEDDAKILEMLKYYHLA